tara:strand:+ start:255 stop:440 length:186 start_codon:yes stop_codon:yes gene_type:complete
MQFQKKTSLGLGSPIIRIFLKIAIVFGILFLLIMLIDKIEFPYPNKDIKQIVPNENFKVIK